ncbi:hypothetical protein NLJ89_g168 [Agrocybe chaxingu]|uniref:Uncharacterized protein n=1 Tax=Agrocybe chaxingu TaxID=84603 RepID=A0A9W8N2D2_9AGAR|nr:hypothetical protein NLJ89_g168 [Agrocybe chaxingu]
MSESIALDSSRSSTLITLPAGTAYNGESCFDALQEDEEAVPDWSLCVHPQGWVYFFNPLLKVVTDQDIRKPSVFELTKENCLQYPLDELSDGMEVHLHLQSLIGNGNTSVFGLAVNHVHCVASYDLQEVKSNNAYSLTPKRLNRCRRLYWNYLWNHPAHVPSPSRAIEDASEALTWFYTDNLISGAKSTVPFSKTECDELARIVRELTASSNDRSVSKTVFLSWLLREVCSFRDAEDWGQYTQKDLNALRQRRTNPPQSIHLPPPVVLFLLNFIINVLFFGIPHTYRAHVKATSEYRGRLANVQQQWAKYIERLVREYSHFLLVATVLLSATVGFLAVPNIPEGAQVAGTISALASSPSGGTKQIPPQQILSPICIMFSVDILGFMDMQFFSVFLQLSWFGQS